MYEFAKSENEIIHINEAIKEKKYHCIECKRELIPCQGEIREYHFKHKRESNCNKESYLHKTAKNIIYEKIKNNQNFVIEYPFIGEIKKFNLKDFDIEIEKKDHEFIPDLNLKKENKKIYIEINVTHKIEQNKINSKIPIIEINIKDQNDLKILKSGIWKYSKKPTNFYNCQFQIQQKKYLRQKYLNKFENHFLQIKEEESKDYIILKGRKHKKPKKLITSTII